MNYYFLKYSLKTLILGFFAFLAFTGQETLAGVLITIVIGIGLYGILSGLLKWICKKLSFNLSESIIDIFSILLCGSICSVILFI